MTADDIAAMLQRSRTQAGLSVRELAKRSGVAAAAVSAIERGKSSPTLATMHKLLSALGTDMRDFFAQPAQSPSEMVFPAKSMSLATDGLRRYRFLLPKREDIRFEMIYETFLPGENPEWETLDADIAGFILGGGPGLLEIEGQPPWTLKKGMSFYISAGKRHRAANKGTKPLQLITVCYPPRY